MSDPSLFNYNIDQRAAFFAETATQRAASYVHNWKMFSDTCHSLLPSVESQPPAGSLGLRLPLLECTANVQEYGPAYGIHKRSPRVRRECLLQYAEHILPGREVAEPALYNQDGRLHAVRNGAAYTLHLYT